MVSSVGKLEELLSQTFLGELFAWKLYYPDIFNATLIDPKVFSFALSQRIN